MFLVIGIVLFIFACVVLGQCMSDEERKVRQQGWLHWTWFVPMLGFIACLFVAFWGDGSKNHAWVAAGIGIALAALAVFIITGWPNYGREARRRNKGRRYSSS